ncbi:Protein kinase protein rad53 [Entomophthora muscae]|uniref:Protein kinase protein rad53 n=1 Tax=Entomophthora muscae TaxID=34485 RepID=A0ACC2SDZ9_9FUNG|nr:Protein kinase protein rad53 [Entomophthora muscae]
MFQTQSQPIEPCTPTQILSEVTLLPTQEPEDALGYLEGLANGQLTKFYIYPHKTFKLGRSNACDVTLTNNSVSTVHFKIRQVFAEDSIFCPLLIEDFSSNGTCVNKRRLKKGVPDLLDDGDKILVLPSYQYVFRYLQGDPGKKLKVNALQDILIMKQIMDYFITRHTVGTGSFATVKLAVCRKSSQQCAVKIIRRSKFDLSARLGDSEKFFSEIEIMKKLKHPNIVQILDVYDSDHLYIFLPYIAGGDLHGYITNQNEESVSEERSCFIMFQILLALKYLHDMKIAHRDIKVSNTHELS